MPVQGGSADLRTWWTNRAMRSYLSHGTLENKEKSVRAAQLCLLKCVNVLC